MSSSKSHNRHFKTDLENLGWQQYFIQQLTLDEWDNYHPGRIIEHHKSELTIAIDQDLISVSDS